MRARRHQLAFDRLDTRLVLDAGAGSTGVGNLAALMGSSTGSLTSQLVDDSNQGPGSGSCIPDPGVLGGNNDFGPPGPMIPDPGVLD